MYNKQVWLICTKQRSRDAQVPQVQLKSWTYFTDCHGSLWKKQSNASRLSCVSAVSNDWLTDRQKLWASFQVAVEVCKVTLAVMGVVALLCETKERSSKAVTQLYNVYRYISLRFNSLIKICNGKDGRIKSMQLVLFRQYKKEKSRSNARMLRMI